MKLHDVKPMLVEVSKRKLTQDIIKKMEVLLSKTLPVAAETHRDAFGLTSHINLPNGSMTYGVTFEESKNQWLLLVRVSPRELRQKLKLGESFSHKQRFDDANDVVAHLQSLYKETMQ